MFWTMNMIGLLLILVSNKNVEGAVGGGAAAMAVEQEAMPLKAAWDLGASNDHVPHLYQQRLQSIEVAKQK